MQSASYTGVRWCGAGYAHRKDQTCSCDGETRDFPTLTRGVEFSIPSAPSIWQVISLRRLKSWRRRTLGLHDTRGNVRVRVRFSADDEGDSVVLIYKSARILHAWVLNGSQHSSPTIESIESTSLQVPPFVLSESTLSGPTCDGQNT